MLISRLGVNAEAETIIAKGRARPDVLFDLRGLRVGIEGKFGDVQNARGIAVEDARGRVRRGIAHIGAAVVYPSLLRTTPTARLEQALEVARLDYCIVSEAEETRWSLGSPADLMDALRRAQETLAKDDIVAATALSLSQRLEGVAQFWLAAPAVCDRLSVLLGMAAPTRENADQTVGRRETAAKVSALVIANALIFQEQLAASDSRVTPLRKLEQESDVPSAARAHWQWISDNINYAPIFQLGERTVSELPLNQNTSAAFRALLDEVKNICNKQSALRHDLMGRIYHWLLQHAKYLGTYYTSVPAATLLLKLTMARPMGRDFGDPAALAAFKVGDLACGTGTLLMSQAHS